jgi:hypothetical protein
MPLFETRIQEIKLTMSPFSSAEMAKIGEVVLDHMVARIKSVKDVTDSPARPLKPTYAEEKKRGRRVALSTGTFRGQGVRDWTLRGRTLSSCKVKYASQERVTIGPTSEESNKIITGRNNLDKMWGLSPTDEEALHAVIIATLQQSPPVRLQLMGYGKKAPAAAA